MLETHDKSGFALRLATLLNDRNFSVAHLADKTKLNQQYIYRVLRGAATPGFHTAVALADALSCTLGDLRDPPEKPVCHYCRQKLEPLTPHVRTDDSMAPAAGAEEKDHGSAQPGAKPKHPGVPDLWPADLATREYPEDRYDQGDTDPADDDQDEGKEDTPRPTNTRPADSSPASPGPASPGPEQQKKPKKK